VAAAAEHRRTLQPQKSLSFASGGRRRGLLHDAAAAALELDVRRPPPSTSALAEGSRGCGWSAAAADVNSSTTQRPPHSSELCGGRRQVPLRTPLLGGGGRRAPAHPTTADELVVGGR